MSSMVDGEVLAVSVWQSNLMIQEKIDPNVSYTGIAQELWEMGPLLNPEGSEDQITLRLKWFPSVLNKTRLAAFRWMFHDINRPGRMKRHYQWTNSKTHIPGNDMTQVSLHKVLIFISILADPDNKSAKRTLEAAIERSSEKLFQENYPFYRLQLIGDFYDTASKSI